MRFQMLGQLAARTDGTDVPLGSPKQRAVLAVLLLHANEVVSTDRIIDLVWGEDPPRTAEHSVQIYISELRKSLLSGSSSELIVTRPPGYVINVPPDTVDIARFERLVRDGLSGIRAGDAEHGRSKLEQALSTWTGDPLSDFAYEEFAQGYIRSLRELRSDALEALAGLELDFGNTEIARDLARRAIEADPLREEPQRIVMLALYRSGRQADALRHFRGYRESLADELGIDASEDLRHLEEKILLQDPALEITPTPPAGGNPYRGLRAFSEDDADVYFGRQGLVDEVLRRHSSGSGFISIVGPSGSGKSSAARAGVVPVLRDRGQTVVVFQPGARPLWELAGALDRLGFGSRAHLLARLESDRMALRDLLNRPVVLVIDQFEELFTLAKPDVASLFADLIAKAVNDQTVSLSVIVTLRADYYDRPLSLPVLASMFSESVVGVKPMTPAEIEQAVVEPARTVGVPVEPALLAQVVADMGDEPGSLPLLQFTLFELFGTGSSILTLADYQTLGGLNGALTAGADELLNDLDPDGQSLVEQMMMRMVQPGRAASTARPVSVRELLDLGVDSVALQEVLEAFGSRRLITFDRDASGSSVIEMAHEYLISEWPQMGFWLVEHSDDLVRLPSLQVAASEWLGSDRSDDFLLRGERLEGFVKWRAASSLQLTNLERQFLDSSTALRAREEASERDRLVHEESLKRTSRRRLWALGAAAMALVAALAILIVILMPPPRPDVILWAEGRDGTFGEMIGAGFDQAVKQHDLTAVEYLQVDSALDPIDGLLARGTPLVVMTGLLLNEDDRVGEMMDRYPETTFVLIDCQGALPEELPPNLTCITSSHAEMGFLAGVASAAATSTGIVGVVVAWDADFMHPFDEGFEQGAHFVDPTIEARSIYLSPIGGDGFVSPGLGWLATAALIRDGADVVFSAAGYSSVGILEGVYDYSMSTGEQAWSIGVDEDQSAVLEEWKDQEWSNGLPLVGWQEHIMTSIVKRLDGAVFEAMNNYFTDGSVGVVELTAGNGGLDYVPSNNLGADAEILEQAKRGLADGSIEIVLDGVDDVSFVRDAVAP